MRSVRLKRDKTNFLLTQLCVPQNTFCPPKSKQSKLTWSMAMEEISIPFVTCLSPLSIGFPDFKYFTSDVFPAPSFPTKYNFTGEELFSETRKKVRRKRGKESTCCERKVIKIFEQSKDVRLREGVKFWNNGGRNI